jgi:phage repressor protein C with HTH and peptisase S24 domain
VRNHAYLFQYLFKRTPRTLDYGDAVKLAQFLDMDPAIFSPDMPGLSRLSEPPHQTTPKQPEPACSDVPIYGPAKGSSLAIGVGGKDIGRAARHPAQKDMTNAFAFYAIGESMQPRYRAGELVYAVAGKPPVHGQDCVVELQNGEGYLREFDRHTGKDVLCKQLNPCREWKRAATDVKSIHAVVGRG